MISPTRNRVIALLLVCSLSGAFAHRPQASPTPAIEQDEIALFGRRLEIGDEVKGVQGVLLTTFMTRYLLSGRYEDATRICSILLRSPIADNSQIAASASNCLAQASIALGDLDNAEKILNDLLHAQPGIPRDPVKTVMHLRTLGWLYKARGYLALADDTQRSAQRIIETEVIGPLRNEPLMSPEVRRSQALANDALFWKASGDLQRATDELERLRLVEQTSPDTEGLAGLYEKATAESHRAADAMRSIQESDLRRLRVEGALDSHLAILRERQETTKALGRDKESIQLIQRVVLLSQQYSGRLPQPNEALAMHKAMRAEGRSKDAADYLGMARWSALRGVGYPGDTAAILPKTFNSAGAESIFGSPARSGLVAAAIAQLGRVYLAEGTYDQATRFLEAAIQGTMFSSGEDSDASIMLLVDLASVDRLNGNTIEALVRLREALQRLASRSEEEISLPAGRTIELSNATERASLATIDLLWNQSDAEAAITPDRDSLIFQAFHLLRRSTVEAGINAAALRRAQADRALAELVENYQTAAREVSALRAAYARLGTNETSGGIAAAAKLATQIEDKKAIALTLHKRILSSVKEGGLTLPGDTSLISVVQSLHENEAIAQFAFDDEKGYVLLTTKRSQFLRPIPKTRNEIGEASKALLKAASFQIEGNKISTSPYPLELAHFLYENTLGPIRDGLDGIERLYIVADRPLEGVPFSALLRSEAPATTSEVDYGKLDWLARYQQLAYLPSAGSLQALRANGSSSAKYTLLGIGKPTGSADPGMGAVRGSYVERAYTLSTPRATPDASIAGDELEKIRGLVGSEQVTLHLGPAATKATLFATPLQDYKVLIFATHGYLASRMSEIGEPSLLLSSVEGSSRPSYLTSSEVASLRLDANLVLLNACDTAGPDGIPGAESLSGLASAFFFAGTRAVIVTLWPIYAKTAESVSVEFMRVAGVRSADSGAAALKHAVLNAIDAAQPQFKHPAFWAPYMIVGDGAIAPL